ncbi:MAG: DUF445 family protein [Bacilli bacterium]|nr:DUF445 family protein [Bacilli bacterium]
MEILRFVLMVLIGGFIGWITNKVAIKLLFRPVNPIKILFVTFQGVFPKRKDQMAVSLAETIEKELLSKEVIFSKILSEENLREAKAKIKVALYEKILEIIPSMIKMFMSNIDELIQNFIDKDGDKLFDEMIEKFEEIGFENLNIQDIVKERIDSLDFVEFEKIIFGLMNKELKHIEIIGLFLGMIIGVIQFGINYFL